MNQVHFRGCLCFVAHEMPTYTLAVSVFTVASVKPGGEALVSCGLMESLLKVIEWPGQEDSITVSLSFSVLTLCRFYISLFLKLFMRRDGLFNFILKVFTQ